jgi:hypothetical protein
LSCGKTGVESPPEGAEDRDRERRIGENEALFREVNERVNALLRPHAFWGTVSDWICECPDETCTERITMTPEEYEELRSNPTHFAVAPDMKHVRPEVESVLERHERYWMVEKKGDAAEVAEDRDIR